MFLKVRTVDEISIGAMEMVEEAKNSIVASEPKIKAIFLKLSWIKTKFITFRDDGYENMGYQKVENDSPSDLLRL